MAAALGILMTVELIHKHLLATLSSVEAALDRAGAIRRLHHHARQGYAAGPINPSMFTITSVKFS
jgi:hypothetical protein